MLCSISSSVGLDFEHQGAPRQRGCWEYCHFLLKYYCIKPPLIHLIPAFFYFGFIIVPEIPCLQRGREALTSRIFWIPLLFFCPLMSLFFYLGIQWKQFMSIPFQSKYKWRKWFIFFYAFPFFKLLQHWNYKTSPTSSVAYSSLCTCKHPVPVKSSLAHGQGFSASPRPEREPWIAAERDGNKVKQRRPLEVCQDLKGLSAKLCLDFVHCNSWTRHKKSLSCPVLNVRPFCFSLSLTWLLS